VKKIIGNFDFQKGLTTGLKAAIPATIGTEIVSGDTINIGGVDVPVSLAVGILTQFCNMFAGWLKHRKKTHI